MSSRWIESVASAAAASRGPRTTARPRRRDAGQREVVADAELGGESVADPTLRHHRDAGPHQRATDDLARSTRAAADRQGAAGGAASPPRRGTAPPRTRCRAARSGRRPRRGGSRARAARGPASASAVDRRGDRCVAGRRPRPRRRVHRAAEHQPGQVGLGRGPAVSRPSPTTTPSRSTVTRSLSGSTSSRLWLIISTEVPVRDHPTQQRVEPGELLARAGRASPRRGSSAPSPGDGVAQGPGDGHAGTVRGRQRAHEVAGRDRQVQRGRAPSARPVLRPPVDAPRSAGTGRTRRCRCSR